LDESSHNRWNNLMGDDKGSVNPERLDAAAFATLYRQYVDAVYRYCYFRLDGREQAEDATSQIFLKALAALPTHRQRDSFRGWLFSIAHNVVTDLYRARRPVWPLSLIENHADDRRSVEDDALQSVEQDEVRTLLARLPVEQRRVLELRLAGLSSSEIADVLGKKTGAVKVAQSRAIARLRQTLVSDARSEVKSED
jgi:RNA polymerase sigma-70 factor, ECF subfamily